MLTVAINVTQVEAAKLLELIGHDEHALDYDVVQLVRALYRTLHGFAGDKALPLELPEIGLTVLHRYVTAQAFGQGGREFLAKLAEAYVEIERLEDLPDVAVGGEDEDEPFGSSMRMRMGQWEAGDAAKEVT